MAAYELCSRHILKERKPFVYYSLIFHNFAEETFNIVIPTVWAHQFFMCSGSIHTSQTNSHGASSKQENQSLLQTVLLISPGIWFLFLDGRKIVSLWLELDSPLFPEVIPVLTNCDLFFTVTHCEPNFSVTSFLQTLFQPENLLGRGLLLNAGCFSGILPPANTICPRRHAANNIVPGKFVANCEAS